MELPSELIGTADLRGNEYAWSIENFPSVLAKARSLGYGCLGGQFQFRLPDATCEMYWLNADPDDRLRGETWSDFSVRSCEETLDHFRKLVAITDFEMDARRWADIPALAGKDATPLHYLFFVADFVTE